jgi:hypothetical protein
MRAIPTMVVVPDAFADVSGFGAVMRRVRGVRLVGQGAGAGQRLSRTPSASSGAGRGSH